ncbi:MAG: hypothetical protein V3W41_09070 [Planctomycetota bacterium]
MQHGPTALKGVAVLALILLLSSCGEPKPTPEQLAEEAWQTAVASDSIDAYERFVAKHGTSSSRVGEAMTIIEAQLWERACQSDDTPSYDAFIARFPGSLRADDAQHRRVASAWRNVSGRGDKLALLAFAKANPDSAWAGEARNLVEGIDYDEAFATPGPERIEAFLQDYPETSKANEARAEGMRRLWQVEILSHGPTSFDGGPFLPGSITVTKGKMSGVMVKIRRLRSAAEAVLDPKTLRAWTATTPRILAGVFLIERTGKSEIFMVGSPALGDVRFADSKATVTMLETSLGSAVWYLISGGTSMHRPCQYHSQFLPFLGSRTCYCSGPSGKEFIDSCTKMNKAWGALALSQVIEPSAVDSESPLLPSKLSGVWWHPSIANHKPESLTKDGSRYTFTAKGESPPDDVSLRLKLAQDDTVTLLFLFPGDAAELRSCEILGRRVLID